jgi:hypothetical protein
MLYVLILITIFILTFVLYFFLMSFKHLTVIDHYIGVEKNSNLPKYIFGISFLIFLGILFLFLKQLSSYQKKVSMNLNTETKFTNNQRIYAPEFQQLLVETYPETQNYYFLYTGSDKSAKKLENIAKNIRKDNCSIPCTINFYDDVNAFTIDRKRVDITDPEKMGEWNTQHYIFVADHYLGYLNAAQYPSFAYYPDKDMYYQELLKNTK